MDIPRHPEFADLEVIEYLALLWPDRSQRAIRDLFARGRIQSEGRPVGARRRVGDLSDLALVGSLDGVERIGGPADSTRGMPCLQGERAPGILFEDSRLVALSKPCGLPVVPDRTRSLGSCLEFLIGRELEARVSKPAAAFVRYRVVHRIDRLTSGLVLLAKTPEVERRLCADFEGRRVRKEYLALVEGSVRPSVFTVNCPVVPGRKGKMRAEVPAELRDTWRDRSAVTEFEVMERWGRFTLLRAMPLTGRTHQIRVHAYAAGYPLAIDPVYNRTPSASEGERLLGIGRLTLHAHRCTLPDDWDEPRSFVCPLPEDLERALDALRRGGA